MDRVRPLPHTLLPLAEFAKLMGINPVHFAGATAGSVMPLRNACSDVWWRYSWQYADHVSHADLAQQIATSEAEIADQLGWWPAPIWIEEEIPWPEHHRPEVLSYSIRDPASQRKGLIVSKKKVIAPGQRATTAIETGASVTYTDEDSDGFSETATITAATTVTDAREIKIYHAGESADPRWEIRPTWSKTISGGTVTITAPSWLFIDPQVLGRYPSDANSGQAIDLDTDFATNTVDEIDVYREYNDRTAAGCQLIWERDRVASEALGDISTPLTQNGTFSIRDAERGIVVPVPATYDSDDGQWDYNPTWSGGREPDRVIVYYYAGARSGDYLAGRDTEPMPLEWAETIAWLATARIERAFCQCSNVNSIRERLRRDLAETTPERSVFLPQNVISNPFGTRRGEVEAWRRVSDPRYGGRVNRGGAVRGL